MSMPRSVALLLTVVMLTIPVRAGGQLEDLILVRFEADPEGAQLLLDGRVLCGMEGGCTRLLQRGRHQVRMELNGYVAQEKLLDLHDGQEVRWTLTPNFGWLTVETKPPGLPVTLDGVELGLSPIVERRVEAGARRIEVQAPCFRPASKNVRIRRGKRMTRRIKLWELKRILKIRALDEKGRSVKARVLVDGEPVGRAPGRLAVDGCASRLEVRAPRGVIWLGPLSFAEEGVTTLDVTVLGGRKPGEMAFVPAGWFMMGCNEAEDDGCDEDEKPYHRVWLDSYYMDVAEVTVGMYRACVDAGACTRPEPGEGCNWEVEGHDDHPANCTDWFQAGAYCAWAGKQLPTEAQWEKAARGLDERIWPWGNEPPTCEVCVMGEGGSGCGTGGTMPVCSKPEGRSPYGPCDMAGNVMEWVEDPQDAGFYAVSPERNPVNPGGDKDELHCLRGGERAYTIINFLRASNRDGLQPEYSNYGIGFRCARWAVKQGKTGGGYFASESSVALLRSSSFEGSSTGSRLGSASSSGVSSTLGTAAFLLVRCGMASSSGIRRIRLTGAPSPLRGPSL